MSQNIATSNSLRKLQSIRTIDRTIHEESQIKISNYNDNLEFNDKFRIKYENLFKLYEKKCNENMGLVIENNQKDNQIIDLNLILKSLNDQLFKLKKVV